MTQQEKQLHAALDLTEALLQDAFGSGGEVQKILRRHKLRLQAQVAELAEAGKITFH